MSYFNVLYCIQVKKIKIKGWKLGEGCWKLLVVIINVSYPSIDKPLIQISNFPLRFSKLPSPITPHPSPLTHHPSPFILPTSNF
jgi:hypothetical protein